MHVRNQPPGWSFILVLAIATLASSANAQSVITSDVVTYQCTGAPCPWGPSVNAHALVWPESTETANSHYRYSVSDPIFLSSDQANGAVLVMTNGAAAVFAGTLASESHRFLTQLSSGGAYEVTGLAPNEYLSVLSDASFAAQIWLPTEGATTSRWTTWTCNGNPCPWGQSTSAHALVWPASAEAVNHHINYSSDRDIYLHSSLANGAVISLSSGVAAVYAGSLNVESHRLLTEITPGGVYQVTGLQAGEYLSVMSWAAFSYEISLPAEPSPGGSLGSKWVTWTCESNPCAWGSSTSSHALVWPQSASPAISQIGYTASDGVYLHWDTANGTVVSVTSGNVTLYAGTLDSPSHRQLMTIGPGGSYQVSGLAPGEYLSGYSVAPFTYELTLTQPPVLAPGVVHGKYAYWLCEFPNCMSPAVYGPVITWPEWSAFSTNNRPGQNSKTVYSVTGGRLYPYMGPWAHGCRVTVSYGTAVIVEWQRGANTWRETRVEAGQTHTIQLFGNENSALIETFDSQALGVTLQNCTPQPIQ